MQGFNHLAMLADTECGGMSVFKPNAGSATRWAGSLPLISWLNETKSPLRRYDLNPAENVAQLDDGSTYHDFSFHDEQWDDVTDVDAACRPVAAFISTMEAGKKVTSSLALPMSLAIIDALKATTPVQAYSYNNAELTISGKQGRRRLDGNRTDHSSHPSRREQASVCGRGADWPPGGSVDLLDSRSALQAHELSRMHRTDENKCRAVPP